MGSLERDEAEDSVRLWTSKAVDQQIVARFGLSFYACSPFSWKVYSLSRQKMGFIDLACSENCTYNGPK